MCLRIRFNGWISITDYSTYSMADGGKANEVVYNRTCTQQTTSGACGCFAYATTVVLGGTLHL